MGTRIDNSLRIEEFGQYLVGLGRARETVQKYMLCAQRFTRYLEKKNLTFYTMSPTILGLYIANMGRRPYNLAPSAARVEYHGVRNFVDWLRQNDPDVVEFAKKVPLPKIRQGKPISLDCVQMERYFSAIAPIMKNEPSVGMAMFLLPYSGLRATEICMLKNSDVEWHEDPEIGRYILLRTLGKGRKERYAPVFTGANAYIDYYTTKWRQSYYKHHEAEKCGKTAMNYSILPLFPHERFGRHLTKEMLERRIRTVREGVGEPNLKVHTMRATYITACISTGASMMDVARAAGHAKIETMYNHYYGKKFESVAKIFGSIALGK